MNFSELNSKLFSNVYEADREYFPTIGTRIIYHLISQREIYELVVYKPGTGYPNGWIELACRPIKYQRNKRIVYEGTLAQWSEAVNVLHDNFTDTV